jgi:hypothetical protein
MTNARQPTTPRDDGPTLLAAGVLAYVAETLLHEAAGHGGVCLAQGHRFLVLAPLWMRCSETSPLLTAAGPAMNVFAALIFFAVLRARRTAPPAIALLLWLGFAFNALVAFGYLGVGAVTGFGDWPSLFAGIRPSAAWRVPALAIAVIFYYGGLRAAAYLFVGWAGGGAAAARTLWRRALLPGAGAAIVACLAELAGGRTQIMALLLALGCTIVVGFSLTSMDNVVARAPASIPCAVPRSAWLIAAGVVVGAVFVGVIGPGLKLG